VAEGLGDKRASVLLYNARDYGGHASHEAKMSISGGPSFRISRGRASRPPPLVAACSPHWTADQQSACWRCCRSRGKLPWSAGRRRCKGARRLRSVRPRNVLDARQGCSSAGRGARDRSFPIGQLATHSPAFCPHYSPGSAMLARRAHHLACDASQPNAAIASFIVVAAH
jgi:hypothetical protein